ncbi:sorting nexin-11 isoform X2 [Heterocephalus glaber]|uniref:Sorting nexin-11 isoform X2 n=1 Tax=Heterocephalus glaber TaxID=10181 RepID=A0AAX6PUT7_HETGA|nr:sorting nexin-11 isoform X2 [Heterocephalus glaber]
MGSKGRRTSQGGDTGPYSNSSQDQRSWPGSFVGSTYWLKSVFISRCCLPTSLGRRMLENPEQEEVITVRVQDPRVQNEGSWNSYVDYKIFLHTNSKAFTAKTSCVRRRYREFVWLRKQLQRNAGLIPVPELPGKAPFFGSSDEFIEKRRQGLQHFLERVLQSVVFLSDSQLHLFLQSQLSVPEIEACVQGRSPTTVADAILLYAMSNCGWAQEERLGVAGQAQGDQPNSCCFLPRSGRRASPSPPPRDGQDRLAVWAPVVDSEAPSLESPALPLSSSPPCCGCTRPDTDEGRCAPQPARTAEGADHAVPLDAGQLDAVWEN